MDHNNSAFVDILSLGAHAGSGLVVGLELMQATVSEGESLECCAVIVNGTAETEHVLLIGSVPFTATGLS